MRLNYTYFPLFPNFYFQPCLYTYYPELMIPEQDQTEIGVITETIRFSEVQGSDKITEKQKAEKTYKRTWTKAELEDIFSTTAEYCQREQKSISDLKISDFSQISTGKRQLPEQIMIKIREVMANGTLKPGKWSTEEDNFLKLLLSEGGKSWGSIAKILNSEIHGKLTIRSSKTCKERWNNYLNPNIDKGAWTKSDILKLLQGYLLYGNKWRLITKLLPQRLEGSIKNRVKSIIRKIKQKIASDEDVNKKIQEICDSGLNGKLKKSSLDGSYLDNFI